MCIHILVQIHEMSKLLKNKEFFFFYFPFSFSNTLILSGREARDEMMIP